MELQQMVDKVWRHNSKIFHFLSANLNECKQFFLFFTKVDMQYKNKMRDIIMLMTWLLVWRIIDAEISVANMNRGFTFLH